jgi:SAM-dependent methyltransferase
MHTNYRYLLYKARQFAEEDDGNILDYGCGRGEVVEQGRELGSNIYGAEVFYEGGSTRKHIEQKGLLGNVVVEIRDDHIPFPDGFFSLVVCNQVLEHVQNLDIALKEIHRILKPGGFFLSLFPSKDVIQEGHVGIPFIHWFSKGSRIRLYYATALRAIGLGYHKKVGKSAAEWARHYLKWIDNYTFYRDKITIFSHFKRYFAFSLIEEDYILFRLYDCGRMRLARIFELFPVYPFGCVLFRKLGGLVILAQRDKNPHS